LAPKEASVRILPAETCATAIAGGDAHIAELPPSTSAMVGPPPTAPSPRILMPAACRNISIGRCDAP
jgi:hypothetical protein